MGVLDSGTSHCEDQYMTLDSEQLKSLQIIKTLFENGDVLPQLSRVREMSSIFKGVNIDYLLLLARRRKFPLK